ncbi:MAG: DUF2851 family protein [Chloroflexi bacterium]|nr:DUF2851 family protein [Chloroflexota bacterium]
MRARTGSGVVAPAAAPAHAAPLQERELVALWLLGRVPAELLPWPLLRAGRAGRGPGPDVREAAFGGPDGVVLCGDVEVHLAASDFVHHGHLGDPAYADVVLHLVWTDDRPLRGDSQPLPGSPPQALPGGGSAPTVEVGPALGRDPARLRRLVRRGPSGVEPCAAAARARGPAATAELVRAEGRRRLAERSWRAAELATALGWGGAWDALLDAALRGSAGRRRETPEQRAALAARLTAALAPDVLRSLRHLAVDGGARPRALIAAFRLEGALGGVGAARAAEVGWNAALPLLAAAAAAYDDAPLARATADLAERWPAPRPYGRTRALATLLGPAPRGAGAQHAQGLLHLQDLWCSRGGCGQCPASLQE